MLVSSEDDVNLALKMAFEEQEQDDDKSCFKVDSFNNPILALKNFKIGFYDLLIIDIVMPQMNGFELSEKIRKIDDKTRTCFLTAGEIPGKVRFDPFREGYQDRFIRLPIANEVLREQIGKIICPVKASVHDTKHKNHPIIWDVMLMGSTWVSYVTNSFV